MALKGLQLAATDCARGVLGEAQLDRIRESIEELVAALDGHGDVPGASAEAAAAKGDAAPASGVPSAGGAVVEAGVLMPESLAPAWRVAAPVLCLAGRGPLDEAASAMLAQLLGKHGLTARVAAHEAASRSGIANADFSGIALVCISYLDISGSPSHLRYLLRRLRLRLPGIPILVGLWPADDRVLSDERMRAVIGADFYTTSLREAVAACVHAAETAGASQAEAA